MKARGLFLQARSLDAYYNIGGLDSGTEEAARRVVSRRVVPSRELAAARATPRLHPMAALCRSACSGVSLPTSRRRRISVHRFLSAFLDNITLIEATRGTLDTQKLGDLANYGDAAVCRRLRAEIQHPRAFLDLWVEVSCAAWHVSRHHEVTATEETGIPDLALGIPGWQLPIQAECKRVGKDASYARFKAVIQKANSQVKRTGQRCHGLLYLDVSDRVEKASFGNALPNEIAKIQETVQRYLCLHYTSIGGVVLLWKGHTTHPLSTKDGREARAYDLNYRSHLIRHRMPEDPLPENAEPIMLEYTGMLHIDQAFAD